MSEPLKILFCQFACHSFSYIPHLLLKSRFAQERRVIERFQKAMCPAQGMSIIDRGGHLEGILFSGVKEPFIKKNDRAF